MGKVMDLIYYKALNIWLSRLFIVIGAYVQMHMEIKAARSTWIGKIAHDVQQKQSLKGEYQWA